MSSSLKEICTALAKSGAALRPIGFLESKDSSVGVYTELPIGPCLSNPVFSNFTSHLCGAEEQWHAHFPTVRSQDISPVLGIYVPGSANLVGFVSLPGENQFDKSVLQPIIEDGFVVEFPITDLPGQESKIAWLGDSPDLNVAFVGSSEGAHRIFAEADCQGQGFDIFGVFTSSPRSGSQIAEQPAPSASYLEKLAAPWLGQKGMQGHYQSGFLFVSKAISSEITGIDFIDHELLVAQSAEFRYPGSSLEWKTYPWLASAYLALATHRESPTPATSEEAARWLLALDSQLSNFHFPDLSELYGKHFPVVPEPDENTKAISGFCSSCGEGFEFDADKFCGNCGEARGEI